MFYQIPKNYSCIIPTSLASANMKDFHKANVNNLDTQLNMQSHKGSHTREHSQEQKNILIF